MITSTQIMWTCIPSGVVTPSTNGGPPPTLAMSLVVTPRLVSTGGDTIAGTIFEQWPAFVRTISADPQGWIVAFFNAQTTSVATMVDHLSPTPDFNVDGADLWRAIFPPTTPASDAVTTKPDDLTIHSYDAGVVAKAIRNAHRHAVDSHARHGKLVLSGADPYSVLMAARKRAKQVLPKMAGALRGHARGAAHHVLQAAYHAETGELGGLGYEMMRHALFYDHDKVRKNLRAERARSSAAPQTATPSPPGANSDFNGIISHLGGQWRLLRKLGLVIDLQFTLNKDVWQAQQTVDSKTVPTNPWNVYMNMPPASKYGASYAGVLYIHPTTHADISGTLFRANVASPPSATSGGTIHNGYLPLADSGQYTVYTEDTEGTPIKLDMNTDAPPPNSIPDGVDKATPMPALRTAGIAVALAARDTSVGNSLKKQSALTASYWPGAGAPPPGNNPANSLLYAEDIVRGYTVEVQVTNAAGVTGPFQSLCLRDTRMYVPGLTGANSFILRDEGYTKATAANAPDDQNEIDLHSALFGWDGWSLGAQRPGRAITAGTPAGDTVQTETPMQPVNTPTPDFPSCQLTVRARAGSLPRLRFGNKYTLRARVVDIAGNDMTAPSAPLQPAGSAPDPATVTSVTYLRYEPVPNPVLVLQAPVTEGEHVENLVIRSNPWGATPQNAAQYAAASASLKPMNPYLATSARWIAPPKGSWSQAEQMGAFDALYFDPIASAVATDIKSGAIAPGQPYASASFLAIKNALFQCSRKESGLFTDTQVWDTSNTSATTPSATNPVQIITPPTAQNLPPPTNPGQPLGTGQYNILLNNGSPVYLPYLPDANAKGFAFRALDASGAPIAGTTVQRTYAPRSGTQWPEIDMPQIVLQDGGVGAALPVIAPNTSNPSGLDGSSPSSNTPVVFTLAPGQQIDVGYGSIVADLSKMAGSDAATTSEGHRTIPPYAPYRKLSLVHAVQQPKPPSALQITPAQRNPGDTSIAISGVFNVDGLTSNCVDMNVFWVERVDTELTDGVKETVDGSHRRFTMKSGRVQSWTLDVTNTSVAFGGTAPAPAIVEHFGDTKTRALTYQVTATSRFREYFPASLQTDSSHFTNSFPAGTFTEGQLQASTLRIPSTARPIAPKILYLVPTYAWAPQTSKTAGGATTTTSVRTGRGVRVFVDRPWYTTGDNEQLAVVVNPVQSAPPGLAALVSQWGDDPTRFPQADVLAPLDQTQVQGGTPVTQVPLAENGQPVTVLAFNPSSFDPVRNLWYFDIEFASSAVEAPFVRLALARFQAASLGAPTFPHPTSGDLRMSNVVLADMIKLTADRTGTYVFNAGDGSVNVTVQGRVHSDIAWTPPSGTLAVARRADDAADARMVYAQVMESTVANPSEFDWYPVGNAINLYPYQPAGSAGNSTLLSFIGSVPKPAGLVAGAKHQLLITEHEVFFTDLEAAFPGDATVINYPPGAMQLRPAPPPPQFPVRHANTTSRVVFSDVLPLPY